VSVLKDPFFPYTFFLYLLFSIPVRVIILISALNASFDSMSSSDRPRFRRAVGRVLIALSFKHSRDRGRGGHEGHEPVSPSCDDPRPGPYPPSPTSIAERPPPSTSPHYCTVVLPSPTDVIVRVINNYYIHDYNLYFAVSRWHKTEKWRHSTELKTTPLCWRYA